MAAQLTGGLVRSQHDRHRVPAHQGTDAMLDVAVARMMRLLSWRYRVQIRCGGGEWDGRALPLRLIHQLAENMMNRLRPFERLHCPECVAPLPCFDRILIA